VRNLSRCSTSGSQQRRGLRRQNHPQQVRWAPRQHREGSNENRCCWQVQIPYQSLSESGRGHRLVCSFCHINAQRLAWFVGVCVLKQASRLEIDSLKIHHQVRLLRSRKNPNKTEIPQDNNRQASAICRVLVIFSLSFCREQLQARNQPAERPFSECIGSSQSGRKRCSARLSGFRRRNAGGIGPHIHP